MIEEVWVLQEKIVAHNLRSDNAGVKGHLGPARLECSSSSFVTNGNRGKPTTCNFEASCRNLNVFVVPPVLARSNHER